MILARLLASWGIIPAAAAADGFPDLPGIWGLTPWGALLGLFVLMTLGIFRGWAVPKATHLRELGYRDTQNAVLLKTIDTLNLVIDRKDEQIGKLLGTSSAFEHFLRSSSPDADGDTQAVGGGG